MKTFDARTLERWRAWLAKHHASESEIWLIFHKKAHRQTICGACRRAGRSAVPWLDRQPRQAHRRRSVRDQVHAAKGRQQLVVRESQTVCGAEGRATAGRARYRAEPEGRPVVDGPPPANLPTAAMRADVERTLKMDGPAWKSFEALAPSHRRRYVSWIAMAKRDETRQERLREAIAMLRRGKTLGLK